MEIESLKIEDLKPYEKNAKLHPKKQIEQIKDSIKRFGMNDPIGIWGKDNIIVEGHGRFIACKELGMKEVPCIRLDNMTDEQRREYTLIHNKTTMNSGFDDGILEEELKRISEEDKGIDMSTFDFDMSFLGDEVKDDGFEPVLPENPVSQTGDIWLLHSSKVMCGDSTDIEQVKTLMGGMEADLLLTDPPYGIDYVGKTKDALKIKNDKFKDDSDLRLFLAKAFTAAKSVMKAGAVFYIWYADIKGYAFQGALEDSELVLREVLIWEKSNFCLGRQDYQPKHEPCFYGWNKGSHAWYSDRKQATVLHFDKPNASRLHPTMKPVELFDYQMKNSSKAGDIVLDLFGGSGTTAIACEQNGRKGYLMELDPHYVDVIVERWQQLTGDRAVLIRDGKECNDVFIENKEKKK